jgi:hypothetical protein
MDIPWIKVGPSDFTLKNPVDQFGTMEYTLNILRGIFHRVNAPLVFDSTSDSIHVLAPPHLWSELGRKRALLKYYYMVEPGRNLYYVPALFSAPHMGNFRT